MKKIFFICIIGLLTLCTFAQEEGIKFEHGKSLDTLLQMAKAENKLIFIDCYTTWCGPCKMLSKNTFSQKEAGDFFNANFINAKFDMEKGEGIQIAAKYGVRAYPTMIYLNHKGDKVHVAVGYKEAQALIQDGKNALDPEMNYQAVMEKIKKGGASKEVIAAYLKTNPKPEKKDSLIAVYFKDMDKDNWITEQTWEIFRQFVTDIEDPNFKYFLENRSEFEKEFGTEEVDQKIMYGFSVFRYYNKATPEKFEALRKIDAALYEKVEIYDELQMYQKNLQKNVNNKETWDALANSMKALFDNKKVSPMEINNNCWFLYENFKHHNNTGILEFCKEYSSKLVKAEPKNHLYLDTYAHILFELGEVEKAIKHQELAIANAQDAPDNLDFYKKELERFKQTKEEKY